MPYYCEEVGFDAKPRPAKYQDNPAIKGAGETQKKFLRGPVKITQDMFDNLTISEIREWVDAQGDTPECGE